MSEFIYTLALMGMFVGIPLILGAALGAGRNFYPGRGRGGRPQINPKFYGNSLYRKRPDGTWYDPRDQSRKIASLSLKEFTEKYKNE